MKKSLVALAVAATLPAFAQAQTSVQLTGSIDVAVESLNKDANGGSKGDLQVNDGIWGGSRFAIVGSEDLGSGTRGIFNLEYRGRADTGAQTNPDAFWHGQAWVGLDGGWGTVKLGRQYTPVKEVLAQGDVTGQSWYYNNGDLAGTASRLNNSVSYATPSLGGLTLVAAYAAGEAEGTGEDLSKLGDTYGIGLLGKWDIFNFGVAYQSVDGATGATGTSVNTFGNAFAAGGVDKIDQLSASISTQIGAFGAGLAYAQSDLKSVAGGSNKTKGFSGGLSYAVTDNGTAYLSYMQNDPEGDDNVESGIGLTYAHGLSKRTFVYAAAGIGKEEQGAGAEDLKPRRFAIGVRHFF